MAEIIQYVDPDAVGAGNGDSWTDAYTSLNAWEAGEQQDLTDGTPDWMHCYCRASSGTVDSTVYEILGWTTAAASYILVEAASTDRASTAWEWALRSMRSGLWRLSGSMRSSRNSKKRSRGAKPTGPLWPVPWSLAGRTKRRC